MSFGFMTDMPVLQWRKPEFFWKFIWKYFKKTKLYYFIGGSFKELIQK
jgi:hypothetical protein